MIFSYRIYKYINVLHDGFPKQILTSPHELEEGDRSRLDWRGHCADFPCCLAACAEQLPFLGSFSCRGGNTVPTSYHIESSELSIDYIYIYLPLVYLL